MKKDQTQLPTGAAALLEDASQARLQLHVDDGECFDALLSRVKRARPDAFRAASP